MPATQFPDDPKALTADLLTELIGQQHPGSVVRGFRVLKSNRFGEEMVSTAARAVLELDYAAGPPLPSRAVLKLPREAGTALASIYVNETRLYLRLAPELGVEMPQLLGGVFDPNTARYGLLLEDLTLRGAHFPNVKEDITVAQVAAVLDTLAQLHARFWQSPRFSGDLAWLETHLAGGVCTLMNELVPHSIEADLLVHRFKRELLQRLGTSAARLLAGTRAAQRHQATLAQTLLHGDTHLGNTYLLPDGRAGLVDWQLTVRGHCMHDVSYLIATALDTAQRRAHEAPLIEGYLARLADLGVSQPPSFEKAWLEHRRAMAWSLYIGWMTVPVTNYGWEINVLNLHRLTTAFEDLQTGWLIDEMLAQA